jgi:putative ABC transport system substrate-binding protein
LPVVGYLSSRTPEADAFFVPVFRQGLGVQGFIEGQNVAIEYRWAEEQIDRLPALAADLVRRGVAVLVATGGSASALAAKAATATIPIVFENGGDPVKLGLVASFSRPGGNATGALNLTGVLDTKRLELLRELLPKATIIAVLRTPETASAGGQQDLEEAAHALGLRLQVAVANSERDQPDLRRIRARGRRCGPRNLQRALYEPACAAYRARRTPCAPRQLFIS